MRCLLLILLLGLVLWPAGVLADEKKAEEKPAKPLTEEQAADAVLEALQAKDKVALKALAEQDELDPWLVADELCYRSEHNAAETFARAAPWKGVEKLPAYVVSRRKAEPDTGARKLLEVIRIAFRTEDHDSAIRLSESWQKPLDSVTTIRIAHAYGMALQRARRMGESAATLRKAGDAAAKLGWLVRACELLVHAGISAIRGGQVAPAIAAWTARYEHAKALNAPLTMATSLQNIGCAHHELGDYPQALTFLNRAMLLHEEYGHRAEVPAALLNIGRAYIGLGIFARALAIEERALHLYEEQKDRAGTAAALGNIAAAHKGLGNYARALTFFERAIAVMEEIGDRAGTARTLGNIGAIHGDLGSYPLASTLR